MLGILIAKKEMRPGFTDLVGAIKHLRVVLFITLSDLRARYKRSVLGPLWLTLGTAIGSAGLGFVWSELLRVDAATFIPAITIGLILWQFIAGVITESASIFYRQAHFIRNISLPLSIHPIQLLLKQLINFLHNIPVFLVVALIFDVPFSFDTLMFIPGLLLTALNLLWISLIIGMLGARFRDFEHLVASVMPLLLFLSPVLYRPSHLPFSQELIWMNPLSYFIELIRSPLLGENLPVFILLMSIIMLIAGWAGTLWLFNRKRNRIVFWV